MARSRRSAADQPKLLQFRHRRDALGSASRVTETGWIVLLKSWLQSLGSPHTQRNFEVTARRFLAGLPDGGLRAATVEDVRDALTSMSSGLSEASARQ